MDITTITIFVLAVFVGFEIITKVPPTLHEKIRNSVDAKAALEVLKENNIDYTHKHNSQSY